jgi:LacI family transcriptional regulator/LacI family repressor for deo operon, udp, cdd, tsx, nupC, and nupG
MKNSTISDVAALAAVSKSTVSAVLNDRSTVKDSTRRTVLRAIDELNYRPSASARRGFRPAARRTISFLVKEAQNLYYMEVLGGIQEVADREGYLVSVFSSEGRYETEQRIVEQCMESEVDGLIVAPILNDDTDLSHVFELKRNRVPFVLLEDVRGIRAPLVDVENVRASAEAVRYLIGLGHSRIAHFTGPAYSQHSEERAAGVRRAFSESQLIFHESMIVPAGDAAPDGYRAGMEYFGSLEGERPTAVTCYNDLVAIGLLRALRELEIRVPEDISVIGFDDLLILDYFPIPLTTVHVPKYEMGKRAAEMLMQQIGSPRDFQVEKVFLDAELVLRASTAPLDSERKVGRRRP